MFSLRRGISSLPVHALLVAGLYGQAAPQTPPAQTAPAQTPQAQTPPAQAPTAETPAPAKPSQAQSPNAVKVDTSVLKKRNFVRLISFGPTLSVLGQTPIQNGDFGEDKTGFSQTSSTVGGGYRIGWGGVVQVRLPGKFAFAGSILLHKSQHASTTDTYEGTDNPNTPLDDRKHTTIDQSSIVNYWDYTALLRWYTKEHKAPGPRAFFEGGLNMRQTHSIRTVRETTLGATTVQDTAPVVPTRSWAKGLTGGVGAQFVDDFGVKLVPEFRYTRWVQPNFDSLSTQSRKNQFEAIVSITF
jgi:hypothetical protein